MPLYYFDSTADGITHDDVDGTVCADAQAARSEATRAMGEMCRDYMPTDGSGELTMLIRDTGNVVIYRITVGYQTTSAPD